MNKNELILNMKDNSVVFRETSSLKTRDSVSSTVSSTSSQPGKSVLKILPRPAPSKEDDTFNVCSIEAAPYTMLAHQKDTQIFALSIEDIDKQLVQKRDCHAERLSLSFIESVSQHLEDVCQMLPQKYHEFLNVFDCSQANKLPPHRPYDHKIELTGDTAPPQSRAY